MLSHEMDWVTSDQSLSVNLTYSVDVQIKEERPMCPVLNPSKEGQDRKYAV